MRISRCQRPARVGRELAVELETSLGEGESVVVGWLGGEGIHTFVGGAGEAFHHGFPVQYLGF